MKTTNFLPGMNPYLESRWPDAHTALIGYIRDALSERLPVDLAVIAEESAAIDTPHETSLQLRADIAVVEDENFRLPADTITAVAEPTTLIAAKPETVRVSHTHRWLEIRDVHDRLITVIEIISPSNKISTDAEKFAQRQHQLLRAGVNTIDIDLIRSGTRTVLPSFSPQLRYFTDETVYLIIAGHARDPDERQLYYCPLRERLPVIAIPLRETDDEVPLDLQPLIDRCYQTGRYWQLSQRPLPQAPLPPAESQWLDEQRVAAGLIDPPKT